MASLNLNLIRMAAAGAITLPLLLGAAACSDDKDDTAKDVVTTTIRADGAGTSADPFCDLAVEADGAVNAARGGEEPDPAAIENAKKAIEAAQEAAPDDIADAVGTVASETLAGFENPEAGPSESFETSYGSMIQWVRSNCGFERLDVTGMDYHFDGIPEELDAGKATVKFVNEGTEMHEMIFFRIADEVTASIDELLALPEEESMSKVEMRGAVFAMPGAEAWSTVDLEVGRYAVLCFIPVGTTPEAAEQMEATGAEPDGPPHFSQGMVHELTVS